MDSRVTLIFSSSVQGRGLGLGSLLILKSNCPAGLGWGILFQSVHFLELVAVETSALPESLFRAWSVHSPGSFTFRPSDQCKANAPVPFNIPFGNHSLCLAAFYLFPRNKLKFNPHTRAGELSFTFSRGECRRIWEQIVKPTHCPVCSKDEA